MAFLQGVTDDDDGGAGGDVSLVAKKLDGVGDGLAWDFVELDGEGTDAA